MGVRTIEESLGVESGFFHPRTGNFRLTDLDCINGLLHLMEAITSVSRKRIRLMDVRGFKDAGRVVHGFHHVGTHSIETWQASRMPSAVAHQIAWCLS